MSIKTWFGDIKRLVNAEQAPKDYGYLGGAGGTVAEPYQDLSRAESIVFEVLTERSAQVEKWGVQYHPAISATVAGTEDIVIRQALAEYNDEATRWKSLNDLITSQPETNYLLGWDTILLEEVFEALEAADRPDLLREELVQVAAVAAAWIENIDRTEAGE